MINEGKIVDIEYGTGNLGYYKVRTGVLKNIDKLVEMGYKCVWSGDLDLSEKLNPVELQKRGYIVIDDVLITSFEREGLPFTITIYTRSQKANIHGDNHVYQNEFAKVRQDYNAFEKVTGIHLNLKKTSKPY
jgi:hypothetical protein